MIILLLIHHDGSVRNAWRHLWCFTSSKLFWVPSELFFCSLSTGHGVALRESCCCRCVALVVSDSERPHRRQPTRLPYPQDSLGKNTGVGCHFLLQWMQMKRESEVAQSCLTHSDPMDCSPPGFPIYGIFQARVLEWGAIAFSTKSPTACQLNTSCNHFYQEAVLDFLEIYQEKEFKVLNSDSPKSFFFLFKFIYC